MIHSTILNRVISKRGLRLSFLFLNRGMMWIRLHKFGQETLWWFAGFSINSLWSLSVTVNLRSLNHLKPHRLRNSQERSFIIELPLTGVKESIDVLFLSFANVGISILFRFLFLESLQNYLIFHLDYILRFGHIE